MPARSARWYASRLLAASFGFLAFLGVTNKWVSWHASIYTYKAYDDVNYKLMAQAAPSLLHGRIIPEGTPSVLPSPGSSASAPSCSATRSRPRSGSG